MKELELKLSKDINKSTPNKARTYKKLFQNNRCTSTIISGDYNGSFNLNENKLSIMDYNLNKTFDTPICLMPITKKSMS